MKAPLPSDGDAVPELLEIFGGPAGTAQVDPTERSIAEAVRTIRGQLLAAAQQDGVGIRELARRLDVSPSAVSRHLRSEGDIRMATAVLIARALGRKWSITLHPDETLPVAERDWGKP